MQSNLFLKRLYRTVKFFGFDPLVFARNCVGIGWYLRDGFRMRRQLQCRKDFPLAFPHPVLTDKADTAGKLTLHYFLQDILVAQRIFKASPDKHVDIGSRVDGFVGHVASFREIEIIDIRSLASSLAQIKFLQVDFMEPLPRQYYNYTDSISCLHAIEHFGLGRYGDNIDMDGHLKGFENLKNMLKPHGKLYFSTPIGTQRIEFNAHRVFGMPYLLKLIKQDFLIDDFYYIDDNNQLHHPDLAMNEQVERSFGCNYGCGIFMLSKQS
jgi:SAM-dependent methyltransferase